MKQKREEPQESNLGITVSKEDDFSEWYNQAVLKAGLADYSAVKGFMIIRPLGYAIWENIQKRFDERIKRHGVKNAYFPLLIPESFFNKEKEHAQGFSPEVAWVQNSDEESGQRLAIRPTSETIICDSFKNWLRSYRDLPIRVNQWCNVVRWEIKMTKLFLRTREFLWQEGHCIYETREEAERETILYLDEYKFLLENELAIPVITGRKTENEKFAGAVYTLTAEALMPDGKALQTATSHYLGQDFMRVFGVEFAGRDKQKHTPHYISWGMSTRLVGAVVMVHGDNKGLVLPPRIAPIQIVIVPILFGDDRDSKVLKEAEKLRNNLVQNFSVELDLREGYSAGWKFNEWELKGVPLRIEIGPKDLEKGCCVFVKRNTGEKFAVELSKAPEKAAEVLSAVQKEMFEKAKSFLNSSIVRVSDVNGIREAVEEKKMAEAPLCSNPECELNIRKEVEGVTARCIPFDKKPAEEERCISCGRRAENIVYFSKNY
ncbi:MAG: proline--tRNA ligase [Candidatus Woesearchaeota archaeon]